MARILVSFSSHILDNGAYRLAIFYEGFLKALVECGNEIKAVNTAEFLPQSWNGDNVMFDNIAAKNLVRDVQDFDPQLIIAFNNSIPRVILDGTTCPVAVWDADSIQFYSDKDYIRDHIARYTFLCFSQAGVTNARQFGAPADRVHFVFGATQVTAEALPQDKNIAFIGTNFTASSNFILMLRDIGAVRVKPVIDALNRNFYGDHAQIIKDMDAEWLRGYMQPDMVASLGTVQNRISILNSLQPLGLTIYGTPDWLDVATYLPWLAMCYNPQKVYSLRHNQDIYNQSRICLNTSHSQATDGFPWRVMDVMASNGCLVSDRKSSLGEFTKGYVDIPMYDTPHEAWELCNKLLGDDIWRRDIVAGSQACIADKGRWSQRLAELSVIFGLDLMPGRDGAGDVAEGGTGDIFMTPAPYRIPGRLPTNVLSKKRRLFNFFVPFLPLPLLSLVARTAKALGMTRVSVLAAVALEHKAAQRGMAGSQP